MQLISENRWIDLPDTVPLVPTCDRSVVEAYNSHYRSKAEYVIQTDVVPEPYIGSPNAPVYLLALNPGFSTDDRFWHNQPSFRKALLGNLAHKNTAYPFYPLNPSFHEAPVSGWWRSKLKPLIDDADLAKVVTASVKLPTSAN